ncbi:hypothetical protein [Halpernia sp. GG3]
MSNFDANILNDITNFFLVVLGITITLFTVIYSFIVNRKEELIKINEEINIGKSTPALQQKKHFNLVYIKKYIIWNRHLLILAIISLVIFVACFLTNRKISNGILKNYFYNFIIITFYSTILYLFIVLWKVVIDFKKKSKL